LRYAIGNYPLTVGKQNPYVDYRLGGVPRYFASPRNDIDMRVPDETLKCVIFIGVQHATATKYIGAGFFISLREKEGQDTFRFTYLVTAGHVADDVEGVPFTVRINKRGGGIAEVFANESGEFKWHRHPKGKVVDIALSPWQVPSREFDAQTFDTEYFLTPELAKKTGIGVGDEVLLVGLFSNIKGEARNIPIVRIGSLAMIPDGPVVPTNLGNMEAYLIETKSFGGLSGSPVYIRQTAEIADGVFKWGTNIPAVIQGYSNVHHLLGVAHGHWNVDPADINQPDLKHVEEGINSGLAIVAPAYHVLDIILNDKELNEMRTKAKEAELSKRKGSTMDSQLTDKFTQHDFESALKKVSRRVEPKKK
jgi:hypothetical protein